MKNLIKLKDLGTGRLYAFLTADLANDFQDSFERPQDLVGVELR